MQVIDSSNNKSTETNYVTLVDIQNMNACSFPDKKNPVSGVKCKEAFQSNFAEDASPVMSDDIMDQIYFAGLAGIGIYILYRIMDKAR
jgi:hypothetical protein